MRPLVMIPLLLLPLTGCASPGPPPPDPHLVRLYCDLALASGDRGPNASDSVRAAIFLRYGTSADSFRAALEPYRREPRRWVTFFTAVSDTLEARLRDVPPPSPGPAPARLPLPD
jgi:hypothetical protein